MVLDVFSRRILGLAMATHLGTQLLAQQEKPEGFAYTYYGGRYAQAEVFDVQTGQRRAIYQRQTIPNAKADYLRPAGIWRLQFEAPGGPLIGSFYFESSGGSLVGINNGPPNCLGSELTQSTDGTIAGTINRVVGYFKIVVTGIELVPDRTR